MKRHQTIIIGAGPIGLEIAAHLDRAGSECVVLDGGPIGSTIDRLFPPATRFFSSPDRLELAGIACPTIAQEKASREEYLAYLRQVVDTTGLQVRTFHQVDSARVDGEGFSLDVRIRSGGHQSLSCRNLVLATGGMGRVRTLGIPGESLPHVRHELGDPHQYHGRRVLIVGGRNGACEAAIRCWRAGAQVHQSYRGGEVHERVKYWIRPELEALIDEGRIHGYPRTVPATIDESSVTLDALDGKPAATLEIDDVLLMIGYEHDPALMHELGILTDPETDAPRFDEQTMETNVQGLYVAGTATAGTQDRFRVFIENCHVHAQRIAAAIAGGEAPREHSKRALEEN